MVLQVSVYQPTIAEFLQMKVKNLGINRVLKDLGIY
jgi:hypothetical protein